MDIYENGNNSVTPTAERAGKKDLCVTLGWSRARLDRRIEADPHFPVLRCGTQGGGWLFDLDAVLAHLAMVPVVRRPGRPAGSASQNRSAGDPQLIPGQLAHAASLARAIETSARELRVALESLGSSMGRSEFAINVAAVGSEGGPF